MIARCLVSLLALACLTAAFFAPSIYDSAFDYARPRLDAGMSCCLRADGSVLCADRAVECTLRKPIDNHR